MMDKRTAWLSEVTAGHDGPGAWQTWALSFLLAEQIFAVAASSAYMLHGTALPSRIPCAWKRDRKRRPATHPTRRAPSSPLRNDAHAYAQLVSSRVISSMLAACIHFDNIHVVPHLEIACAAIQSKGTRRIKYIRRVPRATFAGESRMFQIRTSADDFHFRVFRHDSVHYRVALQNLAVSDPLAILLDYTHRWTKLVIDVHLSLQGHLAGRLEGKSFACLESIACERLVFAEDNMKGIFGSLPSLRAVTLHTEDESSNPELALPWEQLVEVHTQMPPAHAVDLARRCPNLGHWSYADRFTEPWHHGHLSNEEPLTVTLPHLRTINIKQRHRVGVPLLDRLITPSLEKAVLDYSAVSTVDKTGFPRLITRSQCRLQHLSLYSSQTLKGVFLTLLPELTSLKLYPGKGSKALKSHFIYLLAMGDGIGLPRFLPNLKELFISGSMQASPETVAAMINVRKDLGRPIESLSLHIYPDTDSSGRMFEYDLLNALVPKFNFPVYSPMYNEPLAYFSI